jgi:hypothetical protein
MGKPRRNWTVQEDTLLRRVVSNGSSLFPSFPLTSPSLLTPFTTAISNSRPLLWREFAKHIPGRSNKDCRKRWWNSLAENTTKGLWSEDERLIEAVGRHGWGNWNKVARSVGTRNADQCLSHWSQVLDPEISYCDWSAQEFGSPFL